MFFAGVTLSGSALACARTRLPFFRPLLLLGAFPFVFSTCSSMYVVSGIQEMRSRTMISASLSSLSSSSSLPFSESFSPSSLRSSASDEVELANQGVSVLLASAVLL